MQQITNAFLPAKEITDAKLFAGRISQIKDILYALNSEGTNIAIIGGRGIGKTSLARQIYNIGRGNNDILDKLKIPYDSKLDYLPIYYACGSDIGTVDKLLINLLTTRNCLGEWIYDIQTAKKEIEELQGVLDIKVAKLGGEKTTETTTTPVIQEHNISVIFQNVISEIIKSGLASNGILVIVDEFDQITNSVGFAKLLKSLATNTPKIKFCIVGVAQDIQNLIKEHESTNRLFAGGVIKLPDMSYDELNEIISNAETSINKSIQFDLSARKKMIELASGHPYIIHLIGREALKIAYNKPEYIIDEDFINETMIEIVEKEIDPSLESRYKRAVSLSSQREIVLKYLASNIQSDGEISTSEIQNEISFVENPMIYVGQLSNSKYGAEIVKIRERYYLFKDSLFAAYVKAHPRLTSEK